MYNNEQIIVDGCGNYAHVCLRQMKYLSGIEVYVYGPTISSLVVDVVNRIESVLATCIEVNRMQRYAMCPLCFHFNTYHEMNEGLLTETWQPMAYGFYLESQKPWTSTETSWKLLQDEEAEKKEKIDSPFFRWAPLNGPACRFECRYADKTVRTSELVVGGGRNLSSVEKGERGKMCSDSCVFLCCVWNKSKWRGCPCGRTNWWTRQWTTIGSKALCGTHECPSSMTRGPETPNWLARQRSTSFSTFALATP